MTTVFRRFVVTSYFMWGNALGWTISAVIVVLTAALVTWLDVSARAVSPRTSFGNDRSNNVSIELPQAPSVALPTMTDPVDSGPIYHRAITECLKDMFTYSRFARVGQSRDIESVPAINILLEATTSRSANLFASTPNRIINFNNDKPGLEALRTLATCARRAAQLMQNDRPAEAMKLYEAVFSLGVKMVQERLTYAELDAGLTMMAESGSLMHPLARSMGDEARANAVQAFDIARRKYSTDHILPIESVLSTVDQVTLEKHAGDVLFFARNGADRMWRVEAIMSLGRYRFNAGRAADQRTAMTAIKQLCDDPDPVIQTAAAAARDLTIEQYRMLR